MHHKDCDVCRSVPLEIMQILRDLLASRRAVGSFVAIGFGWAAYSAQMPAIKAQIGASDGAYGAMVLVAASGALLSMVLAPLVHRIVGAWAMGLSVAVMAVGFVGASSATGPVLFMLGLFLAAGGSGVADVLANAEVSACESETGRSLMNLNHGLFSVAYAMMALAVGAAREAEWSPMFVSLVLLGILLCMIPTTRLPDRNATDAARPANGAMPHGLVILGGLVVLSAFLGEAASEGWSALHLERTLGGSPAQGAMGPATLALAMGVGRLGGHFLVAGLPPLRVMACATALAAFGLALAGAASTLTVCYIGLALGGLGVSVVGPMALGLVGQAVDPRLRLAAIARAAALGYGAFFMGPPLMGFVSDAYGLRTSFYVIAAVLLLVLVVVLPAWALRLRSQPAAAT